MWQGTATDETIGLRCVCVCVCVAAEAESVLLDRKADVRACVGVCVSNKDESGHTTRTYITLHTPFRNAPHPFDLPYLALATWSIRPRRSFFSNNLLGYQLLGHY
jgi:hypothetical protein